MFEKYDFDKLNKDNVVYVRAIKGRDLPIEMRDQIGRRETLYSVHNSEGERLALVKDRSLAFVLARQNNMEPVAVH